MAGCVLNGAKEVALDAFIGRRIGFLDMAPLVREVMSRMDGVPAASGLDDVYAADADARRIGGELVKRFAA